MNGLPKTATRQRRGCDLNPGPSAPASMRSVGVKNEDQDATTICTRTVFYFPYRSTLFIKTCCLLCHRALTIVPLLLDAIMNLRRGLS